MAALAAGGVVNYGLDMPGARPDMMLLARIDSQTVMIVSATCTIDNEVQVSGRATAALAAATRRITVLAL